MHNFKCVFMEFKLSLTQANVGQLVALGSGHLQWDCIKTGVAVSLYVLCSSYMLCELPHLEFFPDLRGEDPVENFLLYSLAYLHDWHRGYAQGKSKKK